MRDRVCGAFGLGHGVIGSAREVNWTRMTDCRYRVTRDRQWRDRAARVLRSAVQAVPRERSDRECARSVTLPTRSLMFPCRPVCVTKNAPYSMRHLWHMTLYAQV